ncbi:far upstream element-binding protein 1 isoform X2 [Agrilus planipennis]|uniref:Far upstream element-binding protein 1 isoform X2 n=1 Tax=Agrilus planipennis TaxID=224129 RepID=A0A1W4W6R1_AGRPL|nr:far upstream element-binding protein 1 isoform X2 [Agrilus planipennis]
MSEYSAVAPPQQNFNQSSAFAAALQRAKQIAAKINPNSTTGDTRTKRPLEDGAEPDAKKIAGGLAGAAAAAAQASARGAPQNQTTIPNMGGPPGVGGGPSQGQGPQFNEDIKVPDKMVGLIIGRGGEQITRLQAETGCKIQMAPDSAGLPERACSLSGTRDAINRAKELIMNIVQQRGRTEGLGGADLGPGMGGQDANFPPGVNMNQTMGGRNFVEIMIPGPKVGLIIGKGGETIKQLQEKSGAKMVVIQEGPNQEVEKPLRISGDPQKVEYAKQLVYDLIAEKEMQNFNRRGQDNRQQQQFNDYGGGNNEMEVLVPRPAVGVVIGKGGDMIKKIQAETGARVQFHQAKEEGPGDRRCYLSGRPQNVEQARLRIEELIESVCGNRAGGGGGGGGRGGRERFDGRGGNRNGGGQEYGGGWDDRRPPQQPQEVTFTVPSNKCGIIIGRGGETIKQINQQSGAHCELDRRSQNQQDKTFIIRGDPEQIETAKRIISEKVQIPLNFITVGGGNSNLPTAYPGMAPQGYNPQGWGAPAYQQQWGAPHQSTDPSVAAGVQQNSNPNAVQMNPATGQADYSLQWAEYYRSLGMHREAEIIEQQNKTGGATTGVPGTMAATPQTNTATVAAPSSGAVSNGPQPDYSAQWAEYYRSLGKHKEAEAIEAQMKQKNQVGGQGTSNPANGGGMPPGVPGQATTMPGYPQAAAAAAYGAYQQSASGYYGAPGQGTAPQAIQPQGQYGYSGYGYGAAQASSQENQQQ